MRRALVALLLSSIVFSGCALVPQNPNYEGPPPRPESVEIYYKEKPYTAYQEYTLGSGKKLTVKRIVIESPDGEVVADYFGHDKKNENLILVFPLLGGKNLIPNYFASYFAKRGYDTAIIHRSEDFKNPKYFDDIENILRRNIIRDRVAIDFFEKEYGKKNFGSFGISRGAINVAMTASVDPRLKYNVLAMGGEDLPDMFEHAHIDKLKIYRKKVMESQGITKEEFFKLLTERVKTDPKYLAKYMNAKDTLMILSAFDRTVPIKNGMNLRDRIGQPKTIYLAADHFTSLLYTQMGHLLPIGTNTTLFPFDYIESEALDFYDSKFKKKKFRLAMIPYRILQMPFNVIQKVVGGFL